MNPLGDMPAETPSSRDPYLNCIIVGDDLKCSSAKREGQINIPISDILCILPDGMDSQEYTVVFLKDAVSSNTAPKLERTHIETALPTVLSKHLLTEVPGHLNNDCHVVISTASGTGTARVLFGILQQLLAWIGLIHYKVHETQSAQTITELCHSLFIPQAEAGVTQTIVLLSGDGGLCDIIDAFHGTPKDIRSIPNIALIPAGTGNAMASSIGLMAHPKTALMALLRGKPLPLPVFVATFSNGARYVQDNSRVPRIYGGVVASWGIHASLVADSDTVEYRKFGADRFKMAAKELLFPSDGSEAHKYSGTITLLKRDGQQCVQHEIVLEHKKHAYVLATLVSNLEKDFKISPRSAALDGSLRIIHFGPMPSQRVMQLLSAAYQDGQHVQEDDVMYSEIEGLRIDFHEVDEKWRRVCIDGRVVVVEEEGWMSVHKEDRSLVNLLSSEL
ncbi:ATP-NAD kinase-like domain-containing protein [Aspergillus falconensis]